MPHQRRRRAQEGSAAAPLREGEEVGLSTRVVVFFAVLCLTGCPRSPDKVIDAGACVCAEPVTQVASASKPAPAPEPKDAGVHALAVCEAKGKAPLEAARDFAEAERWEAALSCAAQASALMPDDPLAHAERGRALVALDRLEEAKLAYARALAVDPQSLEALLGAAHLYAGVLPSTREVDELGALYAERGFAIASVTAARSGSKDDLELALELGRVAAVALNDVGRNAEAIARAEWVLDRVKDDPEASFERALALFERCKFPEAKAAFSRLLADPKRGGHAHYHLALLLEREGKQAEADRHLARASAASPDQFWTPVILPKAEFERELAALVAALPPEVKRDLVNVPITAEDVPALADLTTGEPPLSPTILGLFRGPPIQEACTPEDGDPCRSVVLYRKNLGRAVKTREELIHQMRVTLLHEVGHLRGEDDGELAARGLE